eukprot:6734568-Lingulodinium_polyedra.AAC.1
MSMCGCMSCPWHMDAPSLQFVNPSPFCSHDIVPLSVPPLLPPKQCALGPTTAHRGDSSVSFSIVEQARSKWIEAG